MLLFTPIHAHLSNRDDAAVVPGLGAPRQNTRQDGDSINYPSAPPSHSGSMPVPESVILLILTIVQVSADESMMITETMGSSK